MSLVGTIHRLLVSIITAILGSGREKLKQDRFNHVIWYGRHTLAKSKKQARHDRDATSRVRYKTDLHQIRSHIHMYNPASNDYLEAI
jgi:hypothetical protein